MFKLVWLSSCDCSQSASEDDDLFWTHVKRAKCLKQTIWKLKNKREKKSFKLIIWYLIKTEDLAGKNVTWCYFWGEEWRREGCSREKERLHVCMKLWGTLSQLEQEDKQVCVCVKDAAKNCLNLPCLWLTFPPSIPSSLTPSFTIYIPPFLISFVSLLV